MVHKGRMTAKVEGDFVVFLIGMRVNSWWKFHKWMPVSFAMPKMQRKLYSDPALGFLGAENFFRFGPLTSCMVSYWKSFEHLDNFAKDPRFSHIGAWRDYNKNVGADGTVGIWHETYHVNSGQFECVYGNMPRFGLAKAFSHTALTPEIDAAKDRIKI